MEVLLYERPLCAALVSVYDPSLQGNFSALGLARSDLVHITSW